MSAAVFRCLSGRRAAAARRIPRRDRGGFERLGPAGGAALGRAGPRAGRGRRVGGGAGAAAPRRCAVHQRRRLWQPGGCRRAGLPLSGAADPAGRTGAIRCLGRVRVLRPDLRQRRCDARAVHLPADVAEGDWIEIGQLGAYGGCLRTAFNGFDRARMVEVRDGSLQAAATSAGEGASFETRRLQAAHGNPRPTSHAQSTRRGPSAQWL